MPVKSNLSKRTSDELSFSIKKTQADFLLDVVGSISLNKTTGIIGPSGSGKTTLLRCLAGLDTPDQGVVHMGTDLWMQLNKDYCYLKPVHQRSLGYVFQEASLFQHLSVADNLQYAIKRRHDPVKINDQQLIELLEINRLHDKPVAKLSGGERQRVAIARALLNQPQILFMDEPLASVDVNKRREILPYLKRLKTLSLPIVYVSHQMDEIMKVTDNVIVLDQGRVTKQGDTLEIANDMAALDGVRNQLSTTIEAKIVEINQQWQLAKARFGQHMLWITNYHYAIDQMVRVRIAAKDVSLALSCSQDSSFLNVLPARVIAIACDINQQHSSAIVSLTIDNHVIYAQLTRLSINNLKIKTGSQVWVQIKSVAID